MFAFPISLDGGRRKFTREEDIQLRRLVQFYGDRDWESISKGMIGRTARQCRHRYNNYLLDTHQYFAWTDAEEHLIWVKFQEMGPKWAKISSDLPGRTGNDVKNRWHKHIAKRVAQDPQWATCGVGGEDTGQKETPGGNIVSSPFLRFVLN
jgi:hypothetical protein